LIFTSKSLNRETGKLGEDLAAKYLQQLGYLILERNFKTKFGEIDLIAQKNHFLIFVEVKYRSSLFFGYPYEAVNKRKLYRLKRLVDFYYLLYKPKLSPKIEILSIWKENEEIKYKLIQGIFL